MQDELATAQPRGAERADPRRWWLAMLALIALLFLSGRLAKLAENPTGLASAVWPPAGANRRRRRPREP